MNPTNNHESGVKTVLVCGATGFVGSHVLESLSALDGLNVIAACRDASQLPTWFKGECRAGDMLDAAYRDSLCRHVDIVCNCFAWTALYGHRAESKRLLLDPSVALIDAAVACGVTRFVNVSTTSAAAGGRARDATAAGIARSYWPHLCNVVAIEDYLHKKASDAFNIINLRLGIFAGNRYGVGLLPILLPRLKTHLVPWVAGGRTPLPVIDGRDLGQAFAMAAVAEGLEPYECIAITGPAVPSTREVIEFIHKAFAYPKPHFSVPFWAAFAFAWLMEALDPLLPWEPLVTRSIVHLLRDTHADNQAAARKLGYRPQVDWREAVQRQIAEMDIRQTRPMSMAKPTAAQ